MHRVGRKSLKMFFRCALLLSLQVLKFILSKILFLFVYSIQTLLGPKTDLICTYFCNFIVVNNLHNPKGINSMQRKSLNHIAFSKHPLLKMKIQQSNEDVCPLSCTKKLARSKKALKRFNVLSVEKIVWYIFLSKHERFDFRDLKLMYLMRTSIGLFSVNNSYIRKVI